MVYTDHIWAIPEVKGNHLLTLLALAHIADDTAMAAISIRDLAQKIKASKSYAAKLISELSTKGHIEVLSTGSGQNNPSRYRLCCGLQQSDSITQADIDRIIEAAQVDTTAFPPLFWSRIAHKRALTSLLEQHDTTVEGLCRKLNETHIAPLTHASSIDEIFNALPWRRQKESRA